MHHVQQNQSEVFVADPVAQADTATTTKRHPFFESANLFVILGQITGNISISLGNRARPVKVILKLYSLFTFAVLFVNAYFLSKYVWAKTSKQQFFESAVVVITSYVFFQCCATAFGYASHKFQHNIETYFHITSKINLDAFQTASPLNHLGNVAALIFLVNLVALATLAPTLMYFHVLSESSAHSIILQTYPGNIVFKWVMLLSLQLSLSYLLFHCLFMAIFVMQCNSGIRQLMEDVKQCQPDEVLLHTDMFLATHTQLHQALSCINRYWGFAIFWFLFFIGISTTVTLFLVFSTLKELVSDISQTIILTSGLLFAFIFLFIITYPGIQANDKFNMAICTFYQEVIREIRTDEAMKREVVQKVASHIAYINAVKSPLKIGNIIDLTRETVLGFCSTLATYLIVMLQFQSTPVLPANTAHYNNSSRA